MKVFKERLKISLINIGKLILFALAYLAATVVVLLVVLLVAIYAYEAIVFLLWTAAALFALMILLLVIFYIYWQFVEPFKISKRGGKENEVASKT